MKSIDTIRYGVSSNIKISLSRKLKTCIRWDLVVRTGLSGIDRTLVRRQEVAEEEEEEEEEEDEEEEEEVEEEEEEEDKGVEGKRRKRRILSGIPVRRDEVVSFTRNLPHTPMWNLPPLPSPHPPSLPSSPPFLLLQHSLLRPPRIRLSWAIV
ncbi:hypothetical protein HZH68_016376 [Vespula germanica]|uniref:Uncharacterized protein n=1 Tax=Vespula germanica TaxID=30212 RepID=A0A834J1K1_VESGE|nr:hypothetical protein HZH68_016376 [Vespula germanica]